MINATSRLAAFCLLAASLTLVGGCKNTHKSAVLNEVNNPDNPFIKDVGIITAEAIRKNPTPELKTMALTSEQRKNRRARALNLLKRQLYSDLDKCLLIDQISHNTEYILP